MSTLTATRTCATPECSANTTGKSKYCRPHRDAARLAWKDTIKADGEARAARKASFADLFAAAYAAGKAAGDAVVPTPMIVVEHANPLDDNSPVVREYAPVLGGVCGFAWIKVVPGNSSFARWLVAEGKARARAYGGGVSIWVGAYEQSMERKEAFARAFAGVLQAFGIKAYSQSRMD